jgi:hypothetical protein
MEMVIEYGCENCGAQLMKPAMAPLDSTIRKEGNRCDDCQSVTNLFNLKGFQCLPRLHSIVVRLCNPQELKQLRRDPKEFVRTVLNERLQASGQPQVAVDMTSTPATLRTKGASH